MPSVKKSKIHWNKLSDVGMPARDLRTLEDGRDRKFLVLCECGIETAYVFQDGSGFNFDSDSPDNPIAWAFFDV